MGSNFHPLPALTTTLQPPPGLNIARPTPTDPSPAQNPPAFTDAMVVRTKVFIDEQGCSPEGELDEDDARSWQWVMYAQDGSGAGSGAACAENENANPNTPVAVIRLVPPPHAPHEALTHPESAATLPKYEREHEPYVKLTRVAVLPEYRGRGLGRVLVDTALDWAAKHPAAIDAAYARVVDGLEVKGPTEKNVWRGLTLVHAQVPVEKMYKRLGFVTDETLGRWDEESIEHVGMWKRVDVVQESR